MKSPNLKKLINAIRLDSPRVMTEAAYSLLDEKYHDLTENHREEIASVFFETNISDVFSFDLSEALYFILDKLEENTILCLPKIIEEASKEYKISIKSIHEALESVIDEQPTPNFDILEEKFLKNLNNIILEGHPEILRFRDSSVRKITVSEASTLAEMYNQMDTTNREAMAETIVLSKSDFESILEFAQDELDEERKSSRPAPDYDTFTKDCAKCGKNPCVCDKTKKEELQLVESVKNSEVRSLLTRYGFHLDQVASKNSANNDNGPLIFKHQSGKVIRVGKLDSLETIKGHLVDMGHMRKN